MKISNVRAVCLGFMLVCVPVCAQQGPKLTFDTGNDFLGVCEHPKDAETLNACTYYVFGVADGIAFTQPSGKPIYCLNPLATMAQERNIAIRFMQAHPERTHTASTALISDALRDAFPCHANK